MKTIITLLLATTLAITASAQTQFDYLGGLPIYSNVEGCFFIDLNTDSSGVGENDLKIVHTDSTIYFESVDSELAYMPSYESESKKDLWSDCSTGQSYNSNRAYIINKTETIGLGTHILPFTHSGYHHYIVINVVSITEIRIRGWVFNITSDNFDCTGVLSIDENKATESMNFTDYNTIGQRVDEYFTGVIIRVYDNGTSKRIIK